jgi:hypothetical protein
VSILSEFLQTKDQAKEFMDMETRRARFKIARDVMLRVAKSPEHKFNLGSWNSSAKPMSESHMVSCGTSACFSGWLAAVPEVHALGGRSGNCGELVFGSTKLPAVSISEFLGITTNEAATIIFPDEYDCGSDQINEYDVIYKLDKILERYERG